jgi:molybdopterin-guanine dinucleotide biosynthesis protein A
MPFISFRLLNFLARINNIFNNSQNKPIDAFIIKTKKGFETLCSLYSKNCIDPILRNIRNKNYKISDIFSSLNTKLILVDEFTCEFNNYELKNLNQDIDSLNNLKIDNLNFFNINTKGDYGNFLTIWNNNHDFLKDFHIRWKYFFYR